MPNAKTCCGSFAQPSKSHPARWSQPGGFTRPSDGSVMRKSHCAVYCLPWSAARSACTDSASPANVLRLRNQPAFFGNGISRRLGELPGRQRSATCLRTGGARSLRSPRECPGVQVSRRFVRPVQRCLSTATHPAAGRQTLRRTRTGLRAIGGFLLAPVRLERVILRYVPRQTMVLSGGPKPRWSVAQAPHRAGFGPRAPGWQVG